MDYFTGKALEYEVDEEEDFDGDEDEDRDEVDSSGSGSAQDSESDGYVPARVTRGTKRRPAAGGASSNPDECKQQ